MDDETGSDVVRAFREAVVRDLRSGAVRPLEDYVAAFPGDRDALEAVYRELEESVGSEAGTLDGPIHAAPAASDAPIERIGPFRLGRRLGSGGMGAVYLAEPVESVAALPPAAPVALKVVHPHLVQNERFLERFRREAELGSRVVHENVARTYDVGQESRGEKTYHYIALEFVEGRTLRELKDERSRVPESLCRHIGRQVCRGLAAVHAEGVVHRDVKPENMLLTPDETVKLMDLGVAKSADATTLTEAGQFVGSVQYAAPEQFKSGGTDIDGRADLHALGLVLYELVTGEHPFGHDDFRKVFAGLLREVPRPASEVNPAVSPFFEQVLQKLLEKDRNARFASAEEVHRVLDEGEDSPWWRERARAVVRESAAPSRKLRVQRETGVLGRDRELEALQRAFAAAAEGRGRAVLLDGEAGIGKTRLVDEAVRRLEADGTSLSFLFGSYPPVAASASCGAFATALLEHFGRERLDDMLRRYLSRAPLLIPAFAAFLRDQAPPEGAQPLDAQALQAAFVHVVQALAAERPLVLLIDDLHFAPREARLLFATLVPAIAEHRVLLLGATRPGVHDAWVERTVAAEHASRLAVERLDAAFVTELLTAALQSERLAESLGGEIAERAAGNPFFVLEILRGLEEGRFLTRTPEGTWEQTGEIGRMRLPDSLAQLVRGRVHGLDEEDREVLEVAACCGFEFDPLLVGAVLEMKEIGLLRRLARVERSRRLVHAVGRRYAFDHHQVQEVLYAGLSELLRERYHAALAEALAEAAGGDPEGAETVEICEHALAGGRRDLARPLVAPALAHLEARFAQEHHITLSRKALDTPQVLEGARRVHVLIQRSVPLALSGFLPDARRGLEEAEQIAASLDDRRLLAKVRHFLAQNTSSSSNFAQAYEEVTAAIEIADAEGDLALLPGALRLEAGCLHRLGRTPDALASVERSLAIARQAGNRAEEAATQAVYSNLLIGLGRYEASVEAARASIEIAREVGNRRVEAMSTGAVGIGLRELGRYDEAGRYAERNRRLAREIGDRRGELVSVGNLGVNQRDVGRYGRARRHFEAAWKLARETGMGDAEATNLLNLGQVHTTLGNLAAARTHLGAAQAKAGEIGFAVLVAFTQKCLGTLAQVEGRTEQAEERLRSSVDMARAAAAPQVVCEALVALAGLARESGRTAEAKALLDEVFATEAAGLTERVLAAAHRALLPGGDPEACAGEVAERASACRFIERMEAYHLLWRATGDPDHLAIAKRLLQELVEHAPADARETVVAAVPLHRAIRDA